ncbi:MAG: DUF2157 domain-containing protein [Eubacteriales bacterium]
MNNQKIDKEIDLLVEHSLISVEQSKEIKNFYKERSKKIPSLENSMLLPLIGVLLIGAGFIALCASNWEQMSDLLKLIVAFIPLIILNVALFKNRSSSSEVLIQCLTFGVAFAILFAFGIVTNVFQTPIDTNILIHMALYSVIPLVYVFNGYWLGVMVIVGAITSSDVNYMFLSIIGLLSIMPYCYVRIRNKLPINTILVLNGIVIYRISYMLFDDWISVYLSLSILLLFTLRYHIALFNNILITLYYVLGVFLCFIDDDIDTEFYMVSAIILAIIGVVIYIVSMRTEKGNLLEVKYYYECCVIMILAVVNVFEINVEFIATLLMLFIFAFSAFRYFKNKSLSGYNKYSFIFTILLLWKMTTLDLPFTVQGVLFIVLGIISILISRYVSKLIKDDDKEQEIMVNE